MTNGEERELCKVTKIGETSWFNGIHFEYHDGELCIYDDGLRESDSFFMFHNGESLEEATYRDGVDLCVCLSKGKPCARTYNPYTGRQKELKVNDRSRKIIQDMFFYQNEWSYLADYDLSQDGDNQFWDHIADTYFKRSKGYISTNDIITEYEVAGMVSETNKEGITPLRVKGCLDENFYYYPSMRGICRYDLTSGEYQLVMGEDNTSYDRAVLTKLGNYFYQIKRKVTKINELSDKIEHIGGYTTIQKLDMNFSEIQNIKIDMLFETACFGGEELMISQLMERVDDIYLEDNPYSMKSVRVNLNRMTIGEEVIEGEMKYPVNTETLWVYDESKGEFFSPFLE